MRLILAAIAAFIFDISFALAGSPADFGPCEREMMRAAQAENIPLSVLYSVGLTETGQHGRLQPYAMNIDGIAVIATSLPEALRIFEAARRRGAKYIDIGCMQINHRFHAAKFSSLEAMFDARSNVAYAAHFLKDLRQREANWTLAVARYNAGPDNNAGQKKYVCAVIGNMVRSGLGAWTENARKFCSAGGA
ncbi:MAG TPA: transglycosylase SLT domain-containing protein [Rhodoblastus sp.]|nr:transglycosylase SLT domain-containing protein [Rhodoblastus sp.]